MAQIPITFGIGAENRDTWANQNTMNTEIYAALGNSTTPKAIPTGPCNGDKYPDLNRSINDGMLIQHNNQLYYVHTFTKVLHGGTGPNFDYDFEIYIATAPNSAGSLYGKFTNSNIAARSGRVMSFVVDSLSNAMGFVVIDYDKLTQATNGTFSYSCAKWTEGALFGLRAYAEDGTGGGILTGPPVGTSAPASPLTGSIPSYIFDTTTGSFEVLIDDFANVVGPITIKVVGGHDLNLRANDAKTIDGHAGIAIHTGGCVKIVPGDSKYYVYGPTSDWANYAP